MKSLITMLDEVGYRGLAGIALIIAVGISGVAAILVGGIWVTWRMWDAMGFPTLALFRGVLWVAYWPALVTLKGDALKNEAGIAIVSFAGWFITLAICFWLGRKIREWQGKIIPR